MKVVLEYDPSSGNISDTGGNIVGTWAGLQAFENDSVDNRAEVALSLKKAGYSAKDIVKLRNAGLL